MIRWYGGASCLIYKIISIDNIITAIHAQRRQSSPQRGKVLVPVGDVPLVDSLLAAASVSILYLKKSDLTVEHDDGCAGTSSEQKLATRDCVAYFG